MVRRCLFAALLFSLSLSGCSGGGGGGVAPAAPADVFANPAPDGAFVGWQANTESDVVAYTITATPQLAELQPVMQTVTAPATGAQLTGLASGVEYALTVVATDSEDLSSPASAEARVYVPRPNTVAELLRFQDAAQYSADHNGDAVVVMRDGQIVFEAYQNAYGGITPHTLASGTKSFSCALMLRAAENGHLGIDERVADVIGEWNGDPNKSQITVRQLLSLQGGLSTNPDFDPLLVAQSDTYELAINDPAEYAPGQAFIYDPLAFQAYALALERRSGEDPVEYLRNEVFAPIGLSGDEWERDAEGHPQMAGGASLTAPMWLRYGQLMLQNGTWESRRVLPAAGVQECLTYRNEAYLGYGITWWLNRPVEDSYDPDIDQVPADGTAGPSGQIAPSQNANVVMAAGVGGQRLYLLPSERLVIVRFGSGDSIVGEWSDDEFLRRLVPTPQ